MKPWEKYQQQTAAPDGPWARYAAPQPEPQSPGVMGRFNQGIANFGDALAGTANRGVNAAIRGGAGLVGVDDPYQLSTTPTADLMDATGIARDSSPPENNWDRFQTGAGEAAGAMVPFAALARGIAGLGGLAGAVGQSLNNPVAQAPLRSMTAELAAGGGAAVGGQLAEEAAGGRYGAIARPFGELAGAAVGALGPAAIGRGVAGAADVATRSLPGLSVARAAITREMAPFTRAGATEIARNRLRSLSADPDGQAALISRDSPLTPAQQTGDPNLIALERTVIDQNPTMRPAFEAGNIEAGRTLADQARAGTAPVAEAQQFLNQRIQGAVEGLNARVARAQQEADRRIAALSPDRTPEANSLIVREELDKAYNAAKAEERALWAQVPDDVPVGTSNARAAYLEEVERAGPVQLERIPADARQWLGGNGLGQQASMREMKALYSELRQAARNARAGENPNAFTASSSDRLADAILRDMDGLAQTNPGVADAYQAARAYTAQMKELFNQGAVGQARTRSATGADRVDPGLVLERTVGSGGTRGAVAIDDLRAAGGDGVNAPVEDYLMSRLMMGGDFTPARGEAFLRRNPEVMERVPTARQRIEDALSGARSAERTQQTSGRLASDLQDPRANVTAAVAQARPGREADAIFSAQNPTAAARQVARQASRDESGLAVRGLKGGVVDHLMTQARSGYAANGDLIISGTRLNGALQNKETRQVLSEIYSPDELSRLDRIAGDLQKLEMSQRSGSLSEISDVQPNRLISFLGGTMAARLGARAGAGTSGASLRTSSMATNRFNRMMEGLTANRAEALIRDAVTDPELFRALMLPMDTPAKAARVELRLGEWLRGYTASQSEAENESPVLRALMQEGG